MAFILLARLRHLGVATWADGDALRLRPASAVPPDLLAEVKAHKSELLALLAENDQGTHSALPSPSAEQADAERQDRAAIVEVDCGIKAARCGLTDRVRQAALLRGLQAVAQQRPPSWPDPSLSPPRGAWCSCCFGARWWHEREAPSSWRCWTCHPPDHFTADAVKQTCT